MKIENLDNFNTDDPLLINTLLWIESKNIAIYKDKDADKLEYLKKIYQKISKFDSNIPILHLDIINDRIVYSLKKITNNNYWYGIEGKEDYLKGILKAIKNNNSNGVLLEARLLNRNWEIFEDEEHRVKFEFILDKNAIKDNSKEIENQAYELWKLENNKEIWLHNGKIPFFKTFLGQKISNKIEKSVDIVDEFEEEIFFNKENWKNHFEEWNKELKQSYDSFENIIKLREFFKNNKLENNAIIDKIKKEHLTKYFLKWLKDNYSEEVSNEQIKILRIVYEKLNQKLDNLSKEKQFPILIANIENNNLVYKLDYWNNEIIYYWEEDYEFNTIKQIFKIIARKSIKHQLIHKICAFLFTQNSFSENKIQKINIKENRRVYKEKCLEETWKNTYYQQWKHKNKYVIKFFDSNIYFIDQFYNEDIKPEYESDLNRYYAKENDIYYIYLNIKNYNEDYLIQSYLKEIAEDDFLDFIEKKTQIDEKLEKISKIIGNKLNKLEELLNSGLTIEQILELVNKEKTHSSTNTTETNSPRINLIELGKKGEKFIYEKLKKENPNINIDWPNGNADILEKYGKISPKENRDPYDIKIIKNENGRDITYFIECKATTYQEPVFYLTESEWKLYLRTLRKENEKYILYRIYNLKNDDINDENTLNNASYIKYEDIIESLKAEDLLPYLDKSRQIDANKIFFRVNKKNL